MEKEMMEKEMMEKEMAEKINVWRKEMREKVEITIYNSLRRVDWRH